MSPHESSHDPIPAWLHSTQHERPFVACSACGSPLGADAEYGIIKDFHRDECVLEMALCRACIEEHQAHWSDASREQAEDFQYRLLEHIGHEPGKACDFCGKAVDHTRGVIAQAQCEGDRVVWLSHMCFPCENELHESLSPETREELGRFIGRHNPSPPGMEQEQPRERPRTGIPKPPD